MNRPNQTAVFPRILAVFAVAALAACGSDTVAGDPGADVVDSAGIRVIRSAHAGFDQAPDVVLSDPIFRIGWDESGTLFDRIPAGVLRSDDVVVADAGADRLYVVEYGGEVSDSIGRAGQGPGEFQEIVGLVRLPGDSVLVEDLALYRTSVFGPDGAFGRSVQGRRGDIGFGPSGTTADGMVVWTARQWSPRMDGFEGWLEFPVLGSRGAHERRDTLAELPFMEMLSAEGRPAYRPIPTSGMTAGAADGFAFLMTDRPSLTWHDARDGEPYQRLSWSQPRQPLDDAWYDGFVEARIAIVQEGGGHGSEVEGMREYLESQRDLAPEFAPMIRGLYPASDGSVWILGATGDLMSPISDFLVVPPDGGCLTRVRADRSFRFLDADERFVLGVERNELDVEALVLYEAPGCPEG